MKNRLLQLSKCKRLDLDLLSAAARTAEEEGVKPFLTSSQTKAFDHLRSLAGLLGTQTTYGGFKSRLKPLVVGASGSGKTALISKLAEEIGKDGKPLPLLTINAGCWVVTTAKAEPSTLSVIRNYVRQHAGPMILFLDELDKSTAHGDAAFSDPYVIIVIAEILALLDGDDRLRTAGWSKADIARLSNVLMIGAGAWQRTYRQAQRDGESHSAALRSTEHIPEEISSRFNRRIVEVLAPTRDDYRRALSRLYSDLGLPASDSLLDVVTDGAVAADTGMRFIEDHLADLLIRYPSLRRALPPPDQTAVKRLALAPAAFDAALKDSFDQMAAVEPALAYLQVQVRMHASHFFPKLHECLLETGPSEAVDFLEQIDCLERGLRIRYSTSADLKANNNEALWIAGNGVLDFINLHLEGGATYLQDHRLLGLFTNLQVRISRILDAWGFICSVEPICQ
jgi:cytidylate kinase